VKPVDLMRWLVRLVKMPEGTRILDPFAGSGTTGVACAIEGVDFVGIERDADYLRTAMRRIAAAEDEAVGAVGKIELGDGVKGRQGSLFE